MTPAARRRSCAPPAHTPSQSASQTHLAPPPPRRASGRRLQIPEGPSHTPPRVFSARQWVEAPREPVPAPPGVPEPIEKVVCVRGQVGRGTQLRTGRPCSQVPGSRWQPERLVRRQRAGGPPSAPTPRVRAPAPPSLPPPSAPARRRRFLSPLPPALAPGDPAMPVRTECPPPAGASAASAASLIPPPPINTQQPGVATSLLYSGSKFRGHQKSKGNSYDVEVVLQVSAGPGRAGARGPPRGAHGPCPPPAPRARSRGPGPRRRASCTRRFTARDLPSWCLTLSKPQP